MVTRLAAVGLLAGILTGGTGPLEVVTAPPPPDIVDAVTRGDLARVKELIQQSPEAVAVRVPRAGTLLHVAARYDHEAVASYLIEKGADVNAAREDGRTPLVGAGVNVTRVLLEHGANIDHISSDGFSAISLALHNEADDVFEYLLERGARLVLPPPGTYRRLVAVESALTMANVKAVEIFASQGLDRSFENPAGMTLAHFAAGRGSVALFEKLIGYGAPLDRQDVFGWTPLHVAARAGNAAVVDLLIRKGADKNRRAIDGKTPYMVAREADKAAAWEALAAAGADTRSVKPPILSGPYFGQKPPRRTPAPFVPAIPDIEEGLHGLFAFSPDGRDTCWKPVWSPRTAIHCSHMDGGRWSAPAVAPFSGENQGDDAPFLSPDGSRLFFVSQRPVIDGKMPFPYVEKIWMVSRTAGGWSEPRKLPDEVNQKTGTHWQISVDANDNLYFGARGGVYCARFVEGRYLPAEALGPAINDGRTVAFSPFIAPDGRYLIFSRTHAVYAYQLWISFRRTDGTWSEAVDLGAVLGHPHSLNGRVSPDGKYLFFAGRSGVTYWVDASVIHGLRPGDGPRTSTGAISR